MNRRQAILLVNLGSPDAPDVASVRRYLDEFLMDERVIDLPYWKRWLLVRGIILRFRPRKTAEAYHKIWWPEGAPLVVISQRVKMAVQKRVDRHVALAMRYQNPSIETVCRDLNDKGVQEILLVPLYPHYAMSSTETVVEKVRETLRAVAPHITLNTVPPFYDFPEYIAALAASSERFLQHPYDHLLFSFHGLPERHLLKSDPTGHHCLKVENCCQTPSPAHQTCYRAQCFRTVEAFVKAARVPALKFSVAFQSRLGRDPWLQPFTDKEIVRLARAGAKKVLVICPSFVADCLETLEEIGLRGQETFRAAGGQELTLIPCLNIHPQWIEALVKLIEKHSQA